MAIESLMRRVELKERHSSRGTSPEGENLRTWFRLVFGCLKERDHRHRQNLFVALYMEFGNTPRLFRREQSSLEW
jgi:hypothetical protein